MAFTATDLANVESAIVTISTQGVAELEINGQRTKYIDIDKLLRLRDQIKSELSSASRGSAFIKPRFVDPE